MNLSFLGLILLWSCQASQNVQPTSSTSRRIFDTPSYDKKNLQEAILKSPDNRELKLQRIEEYLASSQVELAKYLLDSLGDPSTTRDWSTRGEVFYRLNRYQEAEAALLKALVLDPKHSRTLETLALIYIRSHHFEKAIALMKPFRKSFEKDPKKSFFYALASLELKQNLDEVELILTKLSKIYAGEEGVFFLLGFLQKLRGDQENAKKSMQLALRIAEKNKGNIDAIKQALTKKP